MAFRKNSLEERMKAVSKEICSYSNKTRKICDCSPILKKFCVHQKHLSSLHTGKKERLKDDDNFFISLPHSAPSSQTKFQSRWDKTSDNMPVQKTKKYDPPLQTRLRIKRSKSLGDIDDMSRTQTESISNYKDLYQFKEKKISTHSSTEITDLLYPGTSFKERASSDCDSEETLPDQTPSSPLGDDNDDGDNNKVLPKVIENIQSTKHLASIESNQKDISSECVEIKEEVISDEDDYSMPLFNYSQEDEVILIYDSDEQDVNKSSVTNNQFDNNNKTVDQIPPYGSISNLEDEDTQPCNELNDEDTKEENVKTKRTYGSLQPCEEEEKEEGEPILSRSPKFMKKKISDNLSAGSFENCQQLVKDIKQEQRSDSDDSEDLFKEKIDSQATQCIEMEWENVDIKKEKNENAVEKPYPLQRMRFYNFVECENDESIKIIQKEETEEKKKKKKPSLSSSDNDGLNESLADDGNRDVRIKKKLKTKDLDDDDDDDAFYCSTQVDSHSDVTQFIKSNAMLEKKSKIKPVTLIEDNDTCKKQKKHPSFYDEIDSDDDLFWCATQVDSSCNKMKLPSLTKEPFVLTESDDDDDDDMYIMATQVDKKLEKLSCRGSQSSNTFKLPVFPQAKESKKVHNDNDSLLFHISGYPEEDSDSDESMFSVATQVDDPHALNKDEEEQAYMAQTQVDMFTFPQHKTSKISQNAKKRKPIHTKGDSLSYKYLSNLHEPVGYSDSDDDSVFSLATQVDLDDDTLFMAATQVDPQPFKKFKVPSYPKTNKTKTKTVSQKFKSFLKADKDYDSDDSVYSVLTQVDTESPSCSKTSKLCLKNLKYQNKSTLKSISITDEDYDSDSSMYSVATQIDTPNLKRKSNQEEEEEEEDDIAYFEATQVDTDIDGSLKKTKPMSLKDDVFKVPSFPNKKLKTASSKKNDSKTVPSSHKQSKKATTKMVTEDDKPFSNFLFEIAEGEVEKEIVVISPEKKDVDSEEAEKKFGKFLLDLSDDPAPEQRKLITKSIPVEPLRLKTKKEMRDAFKNQTIKEASNKMVSPEEKLNQKMASKMSPVSDTWLSKNKAPIQKKTKLRKEESISRKINEAKNRLEERYFLSHLDNSRVGWNKASHIRYGCSSTITDVQLPDEDEIRKKGLPLIEGPRRRRPLPDIPVEHLPEEKQFDTSDPADNIPTTMIEPKKNLLKSPPVSTSPPFPTSPPVSATSSPIKSPNVVVSTQLYRRTGLDTFKIPKLPNLKPNLPCNSVPLCKSDTQQASSTKKCPAKPPNELIAEQLHMKPKIIQDNVIKNKTTMKATNANFGYHTKPPSRQIFSSSESSISVLNKQTNYPAKGTAQTTCFDSRNHYLQERRSSSKNTRNLILEHLLKWNPKWLAEQKNIKTTPPIVKMDQLLPLLNSYTSLEDYQSIFRPLLLLEIWESISKDFSENYSKNRTWQVAYCNVQTLNSYLMDYIVYGVISIQDYNCKKQMMEGDLVKMNLQVQNPQNTKAGSTKQNLSYPVMGLVESIRFYDPQLHSEIFNRFPQLALLPEVKSKFKVYRAIIKTHYRKLIHAFTDLMSLELISSLISHLRQFQALMSLSSSLLCPHILNPGKGESAESGVHIPSSRKYNSSQLKAIAAAAYIVRKPSNQPSYCLIQGPPGTGKSHTIIGIINKVKEINNKCKLLLCAPSNGAIDELTRRLINERHIAQAESRVPLKVVRIGNPDNIHEDILSYSLSELLKSNARAGIQKCSSVYPELKRICTNEKKIILKLKDPALEEKNITAEEQKRKLVKDLRNLQEKKKFLTKQFELAQSLNEAPSLNHKQEAELRQSILLKADVICSTLNTCGSSLFLSDLSSRPFDCIIIDEASQCTELDSLIPLQYNCCKLILVGDTEQLAPTVLSQRAAEYNYGQSLFERFCNHFKDLEETTSNPVIMLNCQYRMHPEICKFSSRYIYENKLLSDINLEFRCSPINIVPYLLFDIQNGRQIRSSNTGSLSNPMEAEFTVKLCDYLIGLNGTKSPLAIGVIAPYRQQKNLLRDLLHQRKLYKIEVTTVDGFQGREKDIIIMSCVRAQGSCGKIGFLTNRKRLNVALTRAKFALYIVGHLLSLEDADEDWKSLIQDAHQRKLVVPVHHGDSFKLAVENCVKS